MSRLALALLLAVSSPLAFTQAQKAPAPAAATTYEPSVGQEGKDVVWVPTPQVVVDKMLDMAKVTNEDFVMDLGSGDGRTVITAAKRGARALAWRLVRAVPLLGASSRIYAGVASVADRRDALREMLSRYSELMHANEPVADWPID